MIEIINIAAFITKLTFKISRTLTWNWGFHSPLKWCTGEGAVFGLPLQGFPCWSTTPRLHRDELPVLTGYVVWIKAWKTCAWKPCPCIWHSACSTKFQFALFWTDSKCFWNSLSDVVMLSCFFLREFPLSLYSRKRIWF